MTETVIVPTPEDARPSRDDSQATAHATARSPHRLRLTPDVVGQLGRYITPIVATVRTAFDERRQAQGSDQADKLTIDLTDAATVPSAQLVLLVNLLRQTLGNGVEITLWGVTPAIMGALVTFDLPAGVTLIDTRGRRWTG